MAAPNLHEMRFLRDQLSRIDEALDALRAVHQTASDRGLKGYFPERTRGDFDAAIKRVELSRDEITERLSQHEEEAALRKVA